MEDEDYSSNANEELNQFQLGLDKRFDPVKIYIYSIRDSSQ